MSEHSKIEWTDHTFNPWWGCSKVSLGCDHCYAEALATRFGYGDCWGSEARRRTFGEKHWTEPVFWNVRAPGKVFCGSMCDVFEDANPAVTLTDLDWQRIKLWKLIAQTPSLIWMLLTKRPQHMRAMTPTSWADNGWPENVWALATAENQEWLDRRAGHLLEVPAVVRGLSLEPLLGPVDLGLDDARRRDRLGWVIAGGESGPHARPMHPEWVRSIRDQCQGAGVPFFFKQWGEWAPDVGRDPAGWGDGEMPLLPDGLDCRGYEALADKQIGCVLMRRVGKKAAGRLLDGREWNEAPA